MDALFLVARILLSLIFITSGITAHFVNREQTVPYAASHGVPAAAVLVPASGVVAVGGGVMVALGLWGDLGALLLIGFSLATAFFMHAFWKEDDAQMKLNQQVHFMKNVAMAGGALLAMLLFGFGGDELGLTLTGPLFRF